MYDTWQTLLRWAHVFLAEIFERRRWRRRVCSRLLLKNTLIDHQTLNNASIPWMATMRPMERIGWAEAWTLETKTENMFMAEPYGECHGDQAIGVHELAIIPLALRARWRRRRRNVCVPSQSFRRDSSGDSWNTPCFLELSQPPFAKPATSPRGTPFLQPPCQPRPKPVKVQGTHVRVPLAASSHAVDNSRRKGRQRRNGPSQRWETRLRQGSDRPHVHLHNEQIRYLGRQSEMKHVCELSRSTQQQGTRAEIDVALSPD
jgi:hypothetical protein